AATTGAAPRRVAIVGSGPAGFYTAQRLFRATEAQADGGIQVDMLEALPVPHGLARFGVAPDHPEVKSVTHKFERLAADPRFRYFGNVRVGRDVAVTELREAYDAVVLAYGAEQDRQLGVPGETLPGVLSARDFVGWYNGLPDCQPLGDKIRAWLRNTEEAAVFGVGNVALDVARILLMPLAELAKTDITEEALATLHESRVRHVHLVGRRGPLQVAFTAKELREMVNLPDTRLVVDLPYLRQTLTDAQETLSKTRALKRLMDLLLKGAEASASEAGAQASRSWHLHFLRSPVEFFADTANGHVSGVRLERNTLVDGRAQGTGEMESLACGLALRSIGYKSVPVEGTPFDRRTGIVPNEAGRVVDQGQSVPRLYVAGWLKRGPTGVIASTLWDAQETADALLADLAQGAGTSAETSADALPQLLRARGIRYVTHSEWQQLDAHETRTGEQRGKPREKLTSIERMLHMLKPS
ncbi:hypothetical protein THASP1DRAFT_3543, partial [Thamnocephalis sphaerospora]